MHRTESDNFISVGGLNQFTDGPPGTTVNAVDLNTLFEEICYVITQNGLSVLTVATETNQQLYAAIAAQISTAIAAAPQLEIDFNVKNMLINVGGVDSLTLTSDKIQYINSSGEVAIESNVSDAWVPSTDIVGGEAGSASSWLQGWRDSNGVMKLTVCEEGSADGTTAGFLDASGHTLFTRGAVAGDYLFNTTDFTSTKITTTPTADGQDIAVDDDIFATGEGYKLVKVTAPSGMGAFVANLGLGLQDAGLDLVDSGYTRPTLQEIQTYTAPIEFSTSGSNWTLQYGTISIKQEFSFAITPIWKASVTINGSLSVAATSFTLSIPEVIFSAKFTTGISILCYTNDGGARYTSVCRADSGAGSLSVTFSSTSQSIFFNGDAYLLYKPTTFTRS